MIRLNCSKVTLSHLALKDVGVPPADLAPSTLGNWHVHVVPFFGRTAFVFMNERTLLSFLIYEGQRLTPPGLLLVFEKGQDLVLQSIGVAEKKRRKLAVEAEEVVLSPITSPKARAQCNAIMEDYAQLVEAEGTNGTVSADQMVREVNSRPRKALGWSTSEEVTLELLNATAAYPFHRADLHRLGPLRFSGSCSTPRANPVPARSCQTLARTIRLRATLAAYVRSAYTWPMLKFDWDPKKATANLRKHGVSFEDAQTVFADENAKLIDDPDHSEDEDRFVLLGLSSSLRLLVVCHCYRSEGNVIRIISARKAESHERNSYP